MPFGLRSPAKPPPRRAASPSTKIPYNLQLGAIKFRFSATMGFEYNDNINLAEDGSALALTAIGPHSADDRTAEDFILRPQVNLNALWPITAA